MKALIILMAFICSSCAIKGNFGGLYSNYNKMQSRNPKLYVTTEVGSSVCDIERANEPRVFLVTGSDLKKCIKSETPTVVYLWSPRCKSTICYPLEILQQKCDALGVALFVVAEYYDNEHMNYNFRIKNPVYGVNTIYYNSNLTSNYLRDFISDLSAQRENENKYLYYNSGKFIGSYKSLDDIKPAIVQQ